MRMEDTQFFVVQHSFGKDGDDNFEVSFSVGGGFLSFFLLP